MNEFRADFAQAKFIGGFSLLFVRTFKNGVHPSDQKKATMKKPIRIILPEKGSEVVYPMQQHLGAPAKPVVASGDRVLLGQRIAEMGGRVSSPIHASVSGVVSAIEPRLTPTGLVSQSVIIENDGLMLEDKSLATREDWRSLSREEIIDIVRDAGVVGLGGAGFPTHIKMSPPDYTKIDCFIVNAAECEPYLTSDYRVLIEETDRLLEGVEVMLGVFPNAEAVIAIETNKMEAVNRLSALVKRNPRVDVVPLYTKYPQGAEKQLINAVTGRVVPKGGLPADVGVVVNNADTVIAVHRSVVRGRPLMRRIVTVSGGAVMNKGNYKVRIGMPISGLIEATGGFREEPAKVLCGGPMMGFAMYDLDAPIIKTSSAIVALTEREARLPEQSGCIRCGKCVEHCPMGLMPLELNKFAIAADYGKFEEYDGSSCIECGCCTYICPAKRHLAQSIKTAKRLARSR